MPDSGVIDTALVQVLGAVAYGEWKAYEGAAARAAAAADEAEREALARIAEEERRHHDGFVARLRGLGADPERAMRPYRESLDAYHAHQPRGALEAAVWSYLGEGVADDLLAWLRTVADAETAALVDAVMADEEAHEARATEELRTLLGADPSARTEARRAARRMLVHMARSGGGARGLRFGSFLRVGRGHALLAALATGWVRRLRAIGLSPLPL